MKKYFLLIAAASLLVLGFTSCDDNSDPCSDTTELEGTWSDACASSDAEYRIRTMVFNGDKFEWHESFYTDNTCSTESSTDPVSDPGYFAIVGDGAVAESSKLVFIFDEGVIFKTIYVLTGNSLQRGDEDAALDSAGYPTLIDGTVFTKQ